mmetsp:Transcript_16310/g.44257  ORF Transcript_16310/g.44257 Transcript_16310/m.44257 type:complete len:124 (+) Transcript_16310:3625-3996(+)
MESLVSNDGIEVVRIRNRLDLGHEAADSGGFRNVVVNLQIKSTKAIEAGISDHICELQITLRSFSEALNPESHRHYQILRNCRQDIARSSLVLPWTAWVRFACSFLGALGKSVRGCWRYLAGR